MRPAWAWQDKEKVQTWPEARCSSAELMCQRVASMSVAKPLTISDCSLQGLQGTCQLADIPETSAD